MAKRDSISIGELRQALAYDVVSGSLHWKHRPIEHFKDARSQKSFNTKYAGKEAFTSDDGAGYRQGCINGVALRAHVAAFAIMNGRWPLGEVDHVDGDRSNNSWCNLREVTRTENSRNSAMRSHNTSGVTGVVWHKSAEKWYARIAGRSLGLFETLEEAESARKSAIKKAGFSPRHGQKQLHRG